ncbi:MAG: hypothetical protein J6Y02_01350 [Pseudobutyrivibrio sp.]|nr:hypothetical protein [Pseudobutyrivibrio sp.]
MFVSWLLDKGKEVKSHKPITVIFSGKDDVVQELSAFDPKIICDDVYVYESVPKNIVWDVMQTCKLNGTYRHGVMRFC